MPFASNPSVLHRLRVGAVLLMLLLALFAFVFTAHQHGRAAALPAASEARLPCVSYAPFRRDGHTPFDGSLVVSPAFIEDDLRLLSRVTGCVRTYGIDHGLDAVPAIARRLGLRVVLGAWIGRDAAANTAQLDRALALAREHADVVDLLMVGNEVLLRRELPADQLAALLARARRESTVPVSYADVWEFWLRNGAALRPHVDVVSVHVLPFWEDEPVAVADAVAHVNATLARVQQAFSPLPVFLAETGWPAEGRQRGPARPGRAEQTRFVREWVSALPGGADARWRGNLIEGFDQPWKRALEGAMGGHWGVFGASGEQNVHLAGPVPPSPAWQAVAPLVALGAIFGGAACHVAVARRRERPARPRPLGLDGHHVTSGLAGAVPLLVGALSGALAAPAAVLQWEMLQTWSRSPGEWWVNGGVALAALLCTVFAALRLACRAGAPAGERFAPRRGVVDAFRAGGSASRSIGIGKRVDSNVDNNNDGRSTADHRSNCHHRTFERAFAGSQAALLFAVAFIALGLAFDPRYRPLVWPLLAVPGLLLLALAALGDGLGRGAREERVLAAVCAAAAVWVGWQEGASNTQAGFAAGSWLMLALATAWPHRAAPFRTAGRAATSAPSNSAAAPSSVE